jgi:intracellular septation protein A
MKANGKALLFILVATLANMLATALIFVALLGLYGLTLGRVMKISSAAPVVFVAFAAAVVISGFIYNRVIKKLSAKYNLEGRLGINKR